MRGLAAEVGFANLRSIADLGPIDTIVQVEPQFRVLAQLQSGWRGQPVAPLTLGDVLDREQALTDAAFVFFRGIGNAGLTAPTT